MPRTAPAYRRGRGAGARADAAARWMWIGFGVFAAAIVGLGAWATVSHPTPPAPQLPYTGPIDGIPCTSGTPTGTALAVHLDIWIQGRAMTIPEGTGTVSASGGSCQYWIYTQDSATGQPDNIVRAVPPSGQTATLGDFLDIWGLPLSTTDLMGHQVATGSSIQAYVNGKAFQGDPRTIQFQAHDEIVLQFGPPFHTPVPSSYAFPSGS